jgi:aminoglycoside phosphotransferase (APT) family kinase protein
MPFAFRRRRPAAPAPRRPIFVEDITLASGAELADRLLAQGLLPDEVVFKYVWPTYAPPPDSGIDAREKSENLSWQFERLLAMHRVIPSGVPMPVAIVRSPAHEFIGYLLERVEGETLQRLIAAGALDEARRRLDTVERNVARLHAKSLPHGDLNASNIIAADDGRTLLIDPVAHPSPGTQLSDELCLQELRELLA